MMGRNPAGISVQFGSFFMKLREETKQAGFLFTVRTDCLLGSMLICHIVQLKKRLGNYNHETATTAICRRHDRGFGSLADMIMSV